MDEQDITGQDDIAGPDKAPEKKRNRTVLMGCLILAVIIVILAILFFWLRGCSSQTPGGQGATSSTPAVEEPSITIENRIHEAIHGKSYPSGGLMCSSVFIIEASNSNGVAASIRLTSAPTTASVMATALENVVMPAVPEVTTLQIVNGNGALIDTRKR